MSKFSNFTEYLSGKGKSLVEKPPVEKNPDYKGPKKSKPDKSGAWPVDADNKEKNKGVGAAAPYEGPGSDPGQPKYPQGFGDEGDKKLKYTPSTDGIEKEGGSKKGTFPTTEAILKDTKGMSTTEFAQYMSERTVRSGVELEAVKYIATNPITQHALIRELKKNGKLETFLELLFNTPGVGKLVEGIGPPMHKSAGAMIKHPDHEEEDEDEEGVPKDAGEMGADDLGLEDDEEKEHHGLGDEDDEEDDEDDAEEPDFEDDDDEEMDDEDDDDLGGFGHHPDEKSDEITFDDDDHVSKMKKMLDRMGKH